MIDITSPKQPRPRIPVFLIVILIAGYLFWTSRSDPRPTPVSLKAVVFVTNDESSVKQRIVANSQVIDALLDGLSIDRRTVVAGSDTDEAWLSEALTVGSGQAPCVVFCAEDGSFDAVPTPETIESMKALIQERSDGL